MSAHRYLNWPLIGGVLYFFVLVLCGLFYARDQIRPESQQITATTLVRQSREEVEFAVHGSGLDRGRRAYLTLDAVNRRAVVAKLPIWGQSLDVKVIDNRLYIVEESRGIIIDDLTLPLAPEPLEVIDAGSFAWRLDATESRVYLSSMRRGLRGYSLATQQLLFTIEARGNSYMSVHRGYQLFVAEGREGVSVYDVTDPLSVKALSHLALEGITVDLVLRGDLLLAASGRGGISLVDIRDPSKPQILQNMGAGKLYTKLQIVGKYLYAADGDKQIDVFLLGKTERLTFVRSLALAGSVRDFFLDGERLFVAESTFGVSLIDVSHPANPQRTGTVGTSGNPRALARYGNYLYVASSLQGVQIVDMRRFETSRYMSSTDTPGSAQQVLLDGVWLYVADGEAGLQVFERGDPLGLKLVASVPTRGESTRLVKQGDFLYLGVKDYGLQVYNVASPDAPQRVGSLQTAGQFSDLLARGSSLFAASRNKRKLYRIDITNPRSPWLAETVALPGRPWRIAFAGKDILVAAEKAGLQIVRFEPEAEGRLIGSLASPWPMSDFSTTIGVAVRDDYAYLVQGEQGLLVVDISDPQNPRAVKLLEVPGQLLDISLTNNYAVVSSRWQGLWFFDISQPRQPHLAANIYLPRVKGGFAVDGRCVYVPANTRGLSILPLPLRAQRVTAGANLSLVFPTPEQSGWYDLSIYNGRQLKTRPAVLEIP